jgi:hypothetical protein
MMGRPGLVVEVKGVASGAHIHHVVEEKDYPSQRRKVRLLVVFSEVVVAVKEWRVRAEVVRTF